MTMLKKIEDLVQKIEDKNHPGFGFFRVVGVEGYHLLETAKRIATNLLAPAAAEAEKATPPDPAADSVTCHSCGSTVKFDSTVILSDKARKLIDDVTAEAGKIKAEAEKLIDEARTKAAAVIPEAKAEADKLIAAAKAEAEKLVADAKAAAGIAS